MKSLGQIMRDEREHAIKRKAKQAEVPEHVRSAMTEIIGYLWSDELKRFNENGTKGNLAGEISPHLVLVRMWLEESEK